MRAVFPSVALVLLTACASDVVIEARYTSEGLVAAVKEFEVSVFEGQGCERFDPRGAPSGDASTRSGISAIFTKQGRTGEEELAEVPELAGERYAVVIDGYGPACDETRRENGESICAEFNPDKPRVHRAHGCISISQEAASEGTLALAMVQTAPLGSFINVEEIGLVVYDEERPLPVMSGIAAREPFVVQLKDDQSESVNGARVHWRVSKGSGFLDETQPTLTRPGTYDTSNQTDVFAEGLAFGLVRAGIDASDENGGVLEVEAYAPGYENSPQKFQARALPGAGVEIETIHLDPGELKLARLDDIQPFLVDDFDGDGLIDFVFTSYDQTCTARASSHRIAVIFGGGDRPIISAPAGGLVYSMAAVRDDSGGKSLLAFVSDPCSETFRDGYTRVVDVAIEAWSLTRETISASGRVVAESTCDENNSCTARALDKIAVSAHVGDLNPSDGFDDIAVSRCSFSAGSSRPVDCYAMLEQNHDGEIAVLRPQFVEGRLSQVIAISRLEAENTMSGASEPGGFGEAVFADLNGDSLPDLTWARPTLALSLCSVNRPQAGYQLEDVERIFQHSASLTGGYSIGVGDFTDYPGKDVIISGGFRASGPSSGATLMETEGCAFREVASDVLIGPRASAVNVLVRVANLNGDSRDDALVLHRAQGVLHVYLGSGTLDLGIGPVIEVGARGISSLAVGAEGEGADRRVVAATYSSDENRLVIVRFGR
jgi:hypothetical protein